MQDRFKFRSYGQPNSIIEGMQNLYTFEETENGYNNVKVDKGWLAIVAKKDLKIMQCTGLRDKNGKLIYEGDIVKGLDSVECMKKCWGIIDKVDKSRNYLIVWEDGKWMVGSKGWVLNHHVSTLVQDLEIIGNIYENPELLTESEEG